MDRWLEVGPDAVLAALLPGCLTADPTVIAATGRRPRPQPTAEPTTTDQHDRDEVVTLLTAVARLFVTGTPIAWDA
ncbi:hypothetical protein, partial [Micromonospora sp. DT231]|uniref:hypothetical protein n=1 Tax=Micromonospora sp. DT231 TaxID=3416526 RepID=UPI003CE68E25